MLGPWARVLALADFPSDRAKSGQARYFPVPTGTDAWEPSFRATLRAGGRSCGLPPDEVKNRFGRLLGFAATADQLFRPAAAQVRLLQRRAAWRCIQQAPH